MNGDCPTDGVEESRHCAQAYREAARICDEEAARASRFLKIAKQAKNSETEILLARRDRDTAKRLAEMIRQRAKECDL